MRDIDRRNERHCFKSEMRDIVLKSEIKGHDHFERQIPDNQLGLAMRDKQPTIQMFVFKMTAARCIFKKNHYVVSNVSTLFYFILFNYYYSNNVHQYYL